MITDRPHRFDASSTSDDVVAGLDLTGTTALVTGGSSGLGEETVRALRGAGAGVLAPSRTELDLSDLDSVERYAGGLLDQDTRLDVVVANAGVMACPETRVGPGWEAQFATNHLGHYALVNRLRPALAARSRVVVLTSGVSQIRWDDVHLTVGYDRWEAYGQSKTANRLFAAQLDLLGRQSGLRAFSVAPGYILTPLQRHLTRAEMVAAGWVDERGEAVGDLFKSPAQGAATQLWAAVSPDLEGRGGLHCEDCAVVGPILAPGTPLDPAEAVRLWDYSADLTGLDAFSRS